VSSRISRSAEPVSSTGQFNPLVQPGLEQLLDLAAAPRRREPGPDAPVRDHEERRERVDAEPVGEVGPLIDRNAHEIERLVVPSALEHLGDVGFGASAPSRVGREEEEELRLDGAAPTDGG
jgi:hypothetical protein